MTRGRRLAIWIAIPLLGGVLSALAGTWWLGGALLAPHPAIIGQAPPDLRAESVRIPLKDGQWVSAWWHAGEAGHASVVLLHGIRADRRAMLARARMLAGHGYAVLLVDLPAHGESPGQAITLGWRESAAVTAARDWMLLQRPTEATVAIGVSLGGASILLAPQPSGFDAIVLEAVYSDAHQAIRNRIAMRLGDAAAPLSGLLEWQTSWRLGVPADKLSPINRIGHIGAPVLVIAGGRDRHTLLWESRALYARARMPKAIWILPAAAHVDFQAAAPAEYESRVLAFIQHHAAHPPAHPMAAFTSTATSSGPNGQSSSAPSSRLSTGTRTP